MNYDLHTHTYFSDGKCSVSELLERAKQFDVDVLAVTDHDTIDAYSTFSTNSVSDIQIIPGIEFSTYWKKIGVHILGLNIDLNSDFLKTIISKQSVIREQRAYKIIEKINSKHNLAVDYEDVKTQTFNGNVGRPHIANYLVNNGHAKHYQHAFEKYLSNKKLGNTKYEWLSMDQIIQAIVGSNGIAVLAHPLKYKLTRSKLVELIQDFMEHGGSAIEVVSGKQSPNQTQDLAKITEQFSLYASCGSDFHQPNTPWAELGQFGALPKSCKPIWELFS